MVAAPAASGRAGALLESRAQVDTCVRLIHATPRRGALALAGGGAGALAWLLSTPGASGTVLEASVPYSREAMLDYLAHDGQARLRPASTCLTPVCCAAVFLLLF